PLFTAAASHSAGPTDPVVITMTTGLDAALTNNTAGSGPSEVAVGKYTANPGLATLAGAISLTGASFFDIKVLGSDASDRVPVPITPPVVQLPTPNTPGGTDTPGGDLGRTATFRSSAQLSLALAPSQVGQIGASQAGQSPAGNTTSGTPASGTSAASSGTSGG